MKSPKPHHWASRSLLGLGLVWIVSWASAAPPVMEESCVLLYNGAVLTGRVFIEGSDYRVVKEGSEVRLPANQIERVGGSPEELYQGRRSELPSASAVDHLRLADWCLRHRLWEQASRELLDARSLAPRDRRAALLERRLRIALQQEQIENLVASPRATSTRQTAGALPERLDQLSSQSIERFTRRIQPILVNNCTVAGCHRPGGDRSFQLNRDLMHGLADRRSTMANLSSVLGAIDFDHPRQSPLLLAGREPHGGRSSPIFLAKKLDWLRQMENWVEEVTMGVAPKAVPHAASQVDGVTQAVYETPMQERSSSEGVAPATFTPIDEFDPEIFNRRHRRPQDDEPDAADDSTSVPSRFTQST